MARQSRTNLKRIDIVKMLAKQKQKMRQLRQRGEMPIGPILIIALIVLPLVIALVLYGGEIANSFGKATEAVTKSQTTAGKGHTAGQKASGIQ